MFTLISGGDVYRPEPIGKADVLLAGSKIWQVGKVQREVLDALDKTGMGYDVIDADGCIVMPGFIDPHQHTWVRGRGRPANPMREIELHDIVRAGLTTVAGILGTDSTTRHLTSLLAEARALEIGGITTWIYTGNFQVPPPHLPGRCVMTWW